MGFQIRGRVFFLLCIGILGGRDGIGRGVGGWGIGFNIRVGFIHISLFFARLEWERGLLIYLAYQTSLILNL